MQLTQINLQPQFGGGEVYTAFLCRALDRLGIPTRLFAHPDATFWERLGLPENTRIERASSSEEVLKALPHETLWLLGHGPLPKQLISKHDPRWLLTAMAHMPLQGRNPRSFDGHNMVFPVSSWVREGLISAGVLSWQEPLYGVAELSGRSTTGVQQIQNHTRYDWDQRKLRDRLLGKFQPFTKPFVKQITFQRRPGLTLGIVSRLTPIKQFPLLFFLLTPILIRFPSINIEIFGSGGYASVRDLENTLKPIADRVRFWGHQDNVRNVYAQLDYLMTGLPEKEALGLNVIEAQACNLPVLAIKSPPFTETVSEDVTGYFYRDPREDEGADFSRLLDKLLALETTLKPAQATDHLSRFSFDAFVERLRPIVTWAEAGIRK
jgi:glycosyltransferase involved in cell wall biosynthesis